MESFRSIMRKEPTFDIRLSKEELRKIQIPYVLALMKIQWQ